MKHIKSSLLFLLLLFGIGAGAQTNEDTQTERKWGIILGAGLSTSSTNSDYVRLFSPSLSIGMEKDINGKHKLKHGLSFKLSVFTENLNALPYHSLNEEGQLTSTTFNQTNTYPMLYAGWKCRYPLQDNKLFLRADVGGNLMFMNTKKRKIENAEGTYSLPFPTHLFFDRPEIAIGLEFKQKIGQASISIIPEYRCNLTIGTKLNLVPSFYTFGIKSLIKLPQ